MNKNILTLAIITLLSGCASIPDFTENRQVMINNSQEQVNYGLGKINHLNTENWWLDFNDIQLNNILEKVKEKNVDLKIAKLNLEKSQNYYQLIESNNYPSVNFSSSLIREKLSATGMVPPPYAGAVLNMGQVGLSSSYTLDYLNKTGLLLQEQSNKNEGYKEQIKNVELAINSQVIKTYVYYQYLLQEEKIINDKINFHNQIINAYESGLLIGKYTDNQMNDIKNESINLKNNVNNIEQNKQTTINILTQLAGNEVINVEYSPTIWELKDTLPTSQVDIRLIGQRPDVKYYFANINAQRNHFQSLKSDFYPSISLKGDIGFQKVGFSDLFNKKSIFWNIGPEITLPIFDAGRIKTNYKIAGIDLNIFIENYNKAVYGAIQEVNTNILKEKIAYKNLVNQREINNNQNKNNKNINNLFENGKISKLTATQANMNILNIDEQTLNNELNYITTKIEVIQSLGGK